MKPCRAVLAFCGVEFPCEVVGGHLEPGGANGRYGQPHLAVTYDDTAERNRVELSWGLAL